MTQQFHFYYLPMTNENLYLHKNLYMKKLYLNHPKLETTQMSTGEWLHCSISTERECAQQ